MLPPAAFNDQIREATHRPMCNQGSRKTVLFCQVILAASLAVLISTHLALGEELRKPTFLESGDNDLIRFQMGDIPKASRSEQRALSDALDEAAPVISPEVAADALKEEALAGPAPNAPAQLTARSSSGKTTQTNSGTSFGLARQPLNRISPDSSDVQVLTPKNRRQRTMELERTGELSARFAPDAEALSPSNGLSGSGFSATLPAPSEAAAPEPDFSDTVSARLVTVCLNNPDDASGAKAFDIRRDSPPRYIADVGTSTCARFEPTRHTLYLWKTNDIGALSLILSNRLDLNDEDGTQVTLDWLRDE
ncbi:hypothetical protein ABVF61_09055 [Roseibium sp. HPY-6]|uniref:hypothetical protein n=1 Tax=Roseibium sp. HPY-6 TaxID=3229852 RepID=UPI00338E5B22